ncbi:MAG TPA: alanine racemase [Nitrospiria bacterium]|nr:alanine racemase [Nitrospiria bacterium]
MTAGHPTTAIIDLEALLHNLGQLRRHLKGKSRILAVVKANAYGHGAIPVAQALAASGVQAFGVAFVEEGIALRQAGIGEPILVMAGMVAEQAGAVAEHRLTPVLFHPDQLHWLADAVQNGRPPLPVHVKVDTGMGRLGLHPHEVVGFVRKLLGVKGLVLEGLMSHFADEDLASTQVAQEQIRLFSKVYEELKGEGMAGLKLHMANSAAILSLEAAWLSWVRPGITLYGYAPSRILEDVLPLKPVLTLKTRIASLRRVPAGTTISYGRTFTTRRESLIAVLPIGYADGFPRVLSNRGSALVRGRRAPVVGRVCMDMLMLDVTDIPDVIMGEEAVLLGRQGEEVISAVELADQLSTIPYEILCGIGSRVPRVYTGASKNP